MTRRTVSITLSVTLEALVETISQLCLEDKLWLAGELDRQILQEEDELYGSSPEEEARVEEARRAFEAGDYVTIDELRAELRDRQSGQ